MIGSEVMTHNFYSSTASNHRFVGGDAVLSYFFTKTARPYNTNGSIFGFVPVNKSIFKGGWGEWEGVLHVSRFNLNNNDIQGGQMTRITPMVNWYMSRNFRLEFIYGYGILDRYGLKGTVQFFESRFQITVM
jgi:phosphate-selective porin OprO/OprP